MEICNDEKILPSENVVFQEVSGETVLLNLESELYFGLDPIGTRIWQLIQEQYSVNSVVDKLFDEYDADKQQVRLDVIHLIEQMKAKGLIAASS